MQKVSGGLHLFSRSLCYSLLASLAPFVSLAADYASPRDLLAAMGQLQSGPCNLECHLQIADMYSAEFLEAQRAAVLGGLADDRFREELLVQFFGEEITLDELNSMNAQEFFARQLFHGDRTIPAEYRMKSIKVLSENGISDTEVRLTVVRSGMQSDPDYSEEQLITFVKVGESWRIKY